VAETIRWGILSTAAINIALVPALRQAKRSDVVAVASRSLEQAQAYAHENDIPTAYGRYEDLLADPQVDAIYIPLPHSLHCEWTVKAAARGKHVLCEKPLVLTLAELDEVEAAAQANNVIISEAHAYLHHPQIRKINALIAADELGELQKIVSWDTFYLPPEDQENFRYDPQMGGGSLWDIGVYPVSLAIVVNRAEPPVEVWASQIRGDSGVELTLSGQLRFASGLVAQVASSFRSPARRGALIVGSHGVLHVVDHLAGQEVPGQPPGEGRMSLKSLDESETAIVIPATDAYLAEVEAMEACILDGAESAIPFSLSRDILRTVLALYESADSGQLVRL